jgi:hypothetical protein
VMAISKRNQDPLMLKLDSLEASSIGPQIRVLVDGIDECGGRRAC